MNYFLYINNKEIIIIILNKTCILKKCTFISNLFKKIVLIKICFILVFFSTKIHVYMSFLASPVQYSYLATHRNHALHVSLANL